MGVPADFALLPGGLYYNGCMMNPVHTSTKHSEHDNPAIFANTASSWEFENTKSAGQCAHALISLRSRGPNTERARKPPAVVRTSIRFTGLEFRSPRTLAFCSCFLVVRTFSFVMYLSSGSPDLNLHTRVNWSPTLRPSRLRAALFLRTYTPLRLNLLSRTGVAFREIDLMKFRASGPHHCGV